MESQDTDNSEKDMLLRVLNFHGLPLTKVFDEEHGEEYLKKLNLGELKYDVYSQRVKDLSLQDRAKRLKLHKMIAVKYDKLFVPLSAEEKPAHQADTSHDDEHSAMLPSLASFMKLDKAVLKDYFFQNVQHGSILICKITNRTKNLSLHLQPLCYDDGSCSWIAQLQLSGHCPFRHMHIVDDKDPLAIYTVGAFVRVAIHVASNAPGMMVFSMLQQHLTSKYTEDNIHLGVITESEVPLMCKLSEMHDGEMKYSTLLEGSIGFSNPSNVNYVSSMMGIPKVSKSFMSSVMTEYPLEEMAPQLRQTQASKWAYHSVHDGIMHFKKGNVTEAMQCLNKALTIDPVNVDALVARGALFANSSRFDRAVSDFESALKVNANHPNARKYLSETLAALGRLHEEEKKFDKAIKVYKKCLIITPDHSEAKQSLALLQKAEKQQNVVGRGAVEKTVPATEDAKKKNVEKKRHSSNSSSSSGWSTSSDDSEEKKQSTTKVKKESRERSLSPLSKKMAQLQQCGPINLPKKETTQEDSDDHHLYDESESKKMALPDTTRPPPLQMMNQPYMRDQPWPAAQPGSGFGLVSHFHSVEKKKEDREYEERVRKFLEQTTAPRKRSQDSYERGRDRGTRKRSHSRERRSESRESADSSDSHRHRSKSPESHKRRSATPPKSHRRRSESSDSGKRRSKSGESVEYHEKSLISPEQDEKGMEQKAMDVLDIQNPDLLKLLEQAQELGSQDIKMRILQTLTQKIADDKEKVSDNDDVDDAERDSAKKKKKKKDRSRERSKSRDKKEKSRDKDKKDKKKKKEKHKDKKKKDKDKKKDSEEKMKIDLSAFDSEEETGKQLSEKTFSGGLFENIRDLDTLQKNLDAYFRKVDSESKKEKEKGSRKKKDRKSKKSSSESSSSEASSSSSSEMSTSSEDSAKKKKKKKSKKKKHEDRKSKDKKRERKSSEGSEKKSKKIKTKEITPPPVVKELSQIPLPEGREVTSMLAKSRETQKYSPSDVRDSSPSEDMDFTDAIQSKNPEHLKKIQIKLSNTGSKKQDSSKFDMFAESSPSGRKDESLVETDAAAKEEAVHKAALISGFISRRDYQAISGHDIPDTTQSDAKKNDVKSPQEKKRDISKSRSRSRSRSISRSRSSSRSRRYRSRSSSRSRSRTPRKHKYRYYSRSRSRGRYSRSRSRSPRPRFRGRPYGNYNYFPRGRGRFQHHQYQRPYRGRYNYNFRPYRGYQQRFPNRTYYARRPRSHSRSPRRSYSRSPRHYSRSNSRSPYGYSRSPPPIPIKSKSPSISPPKDSKKEEEFVDRKQFEV